MKTETSVDIIGAGIGGLTTAIALERHGVRSRVFEQAERIQPIGAGLLLGINATQVLNRIGIGTEVEAAGHHIRAMTIADANLSPISRVDLSPLEEEFGARSIAIHRGALQRVLLDALQTTEVVLGHRLCHIESASDHAALGFDHERAVRSPVTIGADGVHSQVRRVLFPDSTMRQAGQTCWRGVAPFSLPAPYRNELTELWGDAGRFGMLTIAAGETYWFAIAPKISDCGGAAHDIDITAKLGRRFEGFAPLVGAILDATDPDVVIASEMEDLRPLPRWHAHTVCLIGDAAHAATPNLGQGACQAIEDAATLADCLATLDVHRAFHKFETLRRPKANRVAKYSWQLGKLGHLQGPLLQGVRNRVIKATPSALNRRRFEKIFELATV